MGRHDVKKGQSKSKYNLKNTRITIKYNKKHVHRENIHNTSKIHETNRSEKKNEEEDEECIFCLEIFLISANGDIWICCMSCSKLKHEDCVGVDPLIKDDITRDFCLPLTSLRLLRW